MILEYITKKEDCGKKLKDILKNKLYISSVLLKKLKLCDGIYVNNVPKFSNYILGENEKINIYLDKIKKENKFSDKFKLIDAPLDILYEDEYLLIVNKNKNMPVHPSSDNYENTLSNIVANYLLKQDIYNIHIITRLDKNTTGICIFAKNEYIQELFVRKKDDINLIKNYVCIVNGTFDKKHDIIEENIARKDGTIILREVNKNGDFAKTEYFVLEESKKENFSVLKIILHTGRTHQIRVHMSYIGHTLLGDDLYASDAEKKDIFNYIKRQALHAYKVSFNHPITNKKITITASIPKDMKILIKNTDIL